MWLVLAIYLVFVVVRPHEWMPALAGVPIIPILALLIFAAWLFRSGKVLSTPQHLAVPVLVLAAIFSRLAMGWLGGAIKAAEDLVPFYFVFLAAAALAEKPEEFERILKVLVLSAVVLVFHGIDQLLHDGEGWTGQTVETSTGAPRIQYIGVFSDPNDLAMLFVGCVPLAMYFLRAAGVVSRMVWGSAAALLMYGVYLTNSRGGLLALIGVILVWGSMRVGKVATGVLAAIALPALIAATRLTGGIDAEDESAEGRIDAWFEGLQMFQQHPVFGVGYGLFTDNNALTAHNSWVLVLAETGFPGYAAWFTATTVAVLMLWRMTVVPAPAADAPARELAIRDKTMAQALFLSTLGMLIAAFFLSRSYNPLFFLMWAWSAGHAAGFAKRNPSFVPIDLRSEVGRWLVLSAGSVAVLFVMVRVLLVL